MSAKINKSRRKRAFTLIELMVVMVIIGILMGGIFRMMKIVDNKNRKSDTVAKLQRLQNAVSGFYSSYGIYPPVPVEGSYADPFSGTQQDSVFAGVDPAETGGAKAARMAARVQPVAFLFPHGRHLDAIINELLLEPYDIAPCNAVYVNPETFNETKWADIQMFQFGLMSFVLPRVYVAEESQAQSPNMRFFDSQQWSQYNKQSGYLESQSRQEMREAAKWIVNLENSVSGYAPSIFDVNIRSGDKSDRDLDRGFGDPENESDDNDEERDGFNAMPFRGPYEWGNHQKTLLLCSTASDSWGQDFYYYSPPPHNSYRLWSSGPNKNTFPPWIPLESLSTAADRKLVKEWTEDDIVGFDGR